MQGTSEHFDVVIVGAGLSGIAAAAALKASHPGRSFVMLDMRERLGGTWDLFRYPGVRSDSDMFTLGYGFKPWTEEKSIASGASILAYLEETVGDLDLAPHLRLRREVVAAEWSSAASAWRLDIDGPDGPESVTCAFLYMAAGYYDYEKGHQPDFPGIEQFRGMVVHPQHWPEDLDCASRRVAVIGSGATAITLVPALAGVASHVTMVQRSPSYVAIDSDVDDEALRLRDELGEAEAFVEVRLRNLREQQARYHLARTDPEGFKKPLFDAIEEIVGRECREAHFTPAYEPWDQRLCLVPNGDLFHAIRDGGASVVTGRIDTFTETGLRMESGEEVEADVVVTATGLRLATLGKVRLTVDGERVDIGQTFTYKGIAFSGVPNLIVAFGYLNSSWTLRIELVNAFWTSLLRRMDELGAARVVPTPRPEDDGMARRPWIADVSSGYLLRHMDSFPAQGDRAPWLNPQVHEETKELLTADPEDGVLQFSGVRP
ncbi:FAD-containing monooxygenase EthA [Nocardioides aromaticivorans]|uniref:FAD-containing monooxygenase EthA n=1 Tax=Nocardioides aromaticivorans TaxID=200618 RepID=A0ABX7PG79_9ACTN|nr:NAD(P)/FAD-dependent oxidoreductase [Nocardioides aromaticivorans]QSR24864.1 FAD-containing monooxygenase EthA [Nocardioides aromaticivorans]